MHGQHVHAVVVAQGALLVDAVPPPLVVDDVVAPDEACQVEGFGGGVEGHRVVPGVVRDRLDRNMPVAGEDNI